MMKVNLAYKLYAQQNKSWKYMLNHTKSLDDEPESVLQGNIIVLTEIKSIP